MAGLAILTTVVWGASAQLGPASVDWESVDAVGGREVSILRDQGGSQRWWVIEPGTSLQVPVNGALPMRLEARPVLTENTDTAAYVLELRLNGDFFHYETNRGDWDPNVQLDGARIGDRDRNKFQLPMGHHELEVSLLAGQLEAVLVRVRQPS